MQLLVGEVVSGGALSDNTLPEIVSIETSLNGAQLLLNVKETLNFFPGHFPGHPIVPGVVQLHWAVTYARTYLSMATAVTDLERLKFTAPIQPNAQLFLTLELDSQLRSVNFRYYDHTQLYSTGRMNYV